MDDNTDRFLKHVFELCEIAKVKLELPESEVVEIGSTFCAGYFDEESLVVATGCPIQEWLPVLVHEYSHLMQYTEDDATWVDCDLGLGIDVQSITHLWIQHKLELTPEQIEDYLRKTIAVELNAEYRAVQTIKEFDLPIDIDRYIKIANVDAYAIWLLLAREDYLVSFADQPEIWENMPTDFDNDYSREVYEKKYKSILMEIVTD